MTDVGRDALEWSIPEDVPNGRCGFTTEYSSLGSMNNVTCWRKTWDESDNGLCIWHADEANKPADKLAADRIEYPERLDGAVLPEVDLANMVSFTDCTLRNADFSGAYLKDARLFRTNLEGADLTDCCLGGANLSGSSLKGANLTKADLWLADINNATLRKADLSDADIGSANLEGSDLIGTDCRDAALDNTNINEADLRDANLIDAYLWAADLTNASLWGSDFTDADLEDANLSNANARAVQFNGASLQGAILTRTDLREADLAGTDLYQVQFSDTRINSLTNFGGQCSYEMDDREPTKNNYHMKEWDITPLEAATWVYRRLEALHEENAMALRTRKYHVRKEEAQRKLDLRKSNHGRYAVATLNRYLTNHGESIKQLVIAWAVTIIGAGLLYPFIGGVKDGGIVYRIELAAEPPSLAGLAGAVEPIARGLYFSIITFTTIGYANVAPHGPWSRVLVGIESLIGAILIALFVYVLGRRVAR